MEKKYILFLIFLGIICLNLPIALILYFLKPDLIKMVITIISSCECIMIGLIMVYINLQERNNIRKNYKVCDGIIKNTKFKLVDSNWLKTPVVSYSVNDKNYEATSNIGINGIFSFFIKNRKIKVYYKEDNPKNIILNNNVFLIVGIMFAIVGVLIILLI